MFGALGAAVKEQSAYDDRGSYIKRQAKKRNEIIYGQQSIKKQVGIFGRPTRDYDIYSSSPGTSASLLQKTLDRAAGGDYYYATASKYHKTTKKVYHVGEDNKKGTRDDIGIADYTKPGRRVRTVQIDGLRYASLSESITDKKKALRDPAYAFRHGKDRTDLESIRAYQGFRKAIRRW